jgi:broad specificity phosphatase PhoE
MSELILIRHGQSLANIGASDEVDCALSDLGHQQAMAAAKILAGQDLTGFTGLVSPYQRARHTARYLTAATGLAFETDPRIREYGKSAVIDGIHFAPESADELIARMLDFVRWTQGRKLVLISHGSPLSLIMQLATRGHCSVAGNFWESVPNCCLWHIRDGQLIDLAKCDENNATASA